MCLLIWPGVEFLLHSSILLYRNNTAHRHKLSWEHMEMHKGRHAQKNSLTSHPGAERKAYSQFSRGKKSQRRDCLPQDIF